MHISAFLTKERIKENGEKLKKDRIEEELRSIKGRCVLKEYQGQL